MISLKDAQYLVAVVDCGHFGKAAEQCFVSQPTLSGQIRKLEQKLGVQLLERHQKSVLVTDAGQALLPKLRNMLLLADEVESMAREQQDPFSGRLRLGIIPSLAAYIMPYLSRVVSEQFPGLQVELQELQTHVQLQRLQQGQLDVALLALPDEVPGLRSLSVWQEQLSLAVGLQHPLAGQQVVATHDLMEETMLLLEDGHCLADQTRHLCQLHGKQGAYRGTSLETLRHMVAMGAGVTLVPELTRLQWLAQGEDKLQFVQVNEPMPAREIGMMCRTSSGRWPLLQGLGKALHEALPNAPEQLQVVPI